MNGWVGIWVGEWINQTDKQYGVAAEDKFAV